MLLRGAALLRCAGSHSQSRWKSLEGERKATVRRAPAVPTGSATAFPLQHTGLDGQRHLTYGHPDGEAGPCASIQLHHEIDVHKDTEEGEQRQGWHLEERQDEVSIAAHHS